MHGAKLKKGKCFALFLIFVSNSLIRNLFFNYFLIMRLFFAFPNPSFPLKKLYCHTDSLALSCIEVSFLVKKRAYVGLDKDRELWQPQLRAHRITCIGIHHV
jgi:hypothetical protein